MLTFLDPSPNKALESWLNPDLSPSFEGGLSIEILKLNVGNFLFSTTITVNPFFRVKMVGSFKSIVGVYPCFGWTLLSIGLI